MKKSKIIINLKIVRILFWSSPKIHISFYNILKFSHASTVFRVYIGRQYLMSHLSTEDNDDGDTPLLTILLSMEWTRGVIVAWTTPPLLRALTATIASAVKG